MDEIFNIENTISLANAGRAGRQNYQFGARQKFWRNIFGGNGFLRIEHQGGTASIMLSVAEKNKNLRRRQILAPCLPFCFSRVYDFGVLKKLRDGSPFE